MIRQLYLSARTVLARPDVQMWIGVGLALVGAERIKRAATQMMEDLISLDTRIDEKRDQLAALDAGTVRYPTPVDVDPLGRGDRVPGEVAGELVDDLADAEP